VTGKPKVEKRIAQLVGEREEFRARSEALSAEPQNRQPQQQSQPEPQYAPQPQQPAQQQYQPQQVLEEYGQAQARIAEEEKTFVESHPDYLESVRRLEPGREMPIPPTSYHVMLNMSNAPDVGYYLSRHPETIAKCGLWAVREEASML